MKSNIVTYKVCPICKVDLPLDSNTGMHISHNNCIPYKDNMEPVILKAKWIKTNIKVSEELASILPYVFGGVFKVSEK